MRLFRNKLTPTRRKPAAQWVAGLSPEVMANILNLVPIGILVAELREGQPLVYVNAAFENITGYPTSEALGKNCRYLQGSDRLQPQIAHIREAIDRGVETTVVLRNYRRDGRLFWNKLHIAPARESGCTTSHYIGLIEDVTDPKEAAEQLELTRQTDRLTGALNRYGFLDQVMHLASDRSAMLLVIKVDIAHFHDINAGFGYEVGDALLRQVNERLQGLSTLAVGRLDADEFAVAYRLASRDTAEAALENVSAVLEPRYVLPGAVVSVRFAIGYTIGEPGSDALTLIRRAGAALKESRSTKLREPRQFDNRADVRSRNRIRMTTELQQALEQNEFILAYQPKFELENRTLVGGEALLRWKHGLFGEQAPDTFIAVAEDTGLILDIGARGFRTVANYAAEINRGRRRPLNFAINVSTVEFVHRDMVQFARKLLEESGVDPTWITLELTESLLAESSQKVLGIFRGLRALGIGIAIDDFGTGYSSLRYLDAFPVTEVKVDRSFVRGISQSAAKRLIVESVIKLGRELGITVVAEGVETEAECLILQQMGCPQGQGYLFSRPVSAETFNVLAGDGSSLGSRP
jgi:PAS domain S-box-containing protein/diguanylate cyclase (GGDEF)-like protein